MRMKTAANPSEACAVNQPPLQQEVLNVAILDIPASMAESHAN